MMVVSTTPRDAIIVNEERVVITSQNFIRGKPGKRLISGTVLFPVATPNSPSKNAPQPHTCCSTSRARVWLYMRETDENNLSREISVNLGKEKEEHALSPLTQSFPSTSTTCEERDAQLTTNCILKPKLLNLS